ncbi:hypothetical protein PHYSODRAFT_286959 [Phytophthora sojae]|uniref:RxLR effector protein n=2 Tax=Phytophthora sojae TaxID=67593 RepID=G4ZW25_PHYSP|nr:hypothetical protein PHYSODRAFT_286959 [Phytophthora sojae]AEK81330.1 Avh437 [Phytophthora sojae]EGZ12307.1 hypothetical protein PHYSODRAFT_286959 [Phytophthora sojae]|eukprot:XP_009532640.1 hypothetical protein PHYSODRAFT_286959 [Phytophthora sojae]
MLAATIAFIVCCIVVSSSSTAKSPTPKTASSHFVSSTGAALESGRLLRASVVGHRSSNYEERANAFSKAYYEKLLEFLSILTGKKKAPVDLTGTYPSSPKADKLTRSKSFPDEKAASPKLTRSQTYSTETVDWDGAIKAAGNIKVMSRKPKRCFLCGPEKYVIYS